MGSNNIYGKISLVDALISTISTIIEHIIFYARFSSQYLIGCGISPPKYKLSIINYRLQFTIDYNRLQ